MILVRAERVDEADLSRYAWSRLRRFQNIPDVEETIMRLHRLGKADRSNARKQATQIRYCVIQAQEYFDAAAAVTLATKPVLFYYCIMSLALAEVLLKQSGDSSLDRARPQHKHHGLQLRVRDLPKGDHPLDVSAASLAAAPLVHPDGERFGSFDLWHRSSREMPLAGPITTISSGGGSSGFHVILACSDRRPPLLAPSGLTLLECFRNIPGMFHTMRSFRVVPNLLRGKISQGHHLAKSVDSYKLIIHPGPKELLNVFFDNMRFHPADGVKRLSFQEMPSGGTIEWSDTQDTGHMRLWTPNGTTWRDDEIRFWPTEQPLNEFGFIYVALYIVGNYVRYFPDRWMRDVEQSSPLALAVEEFLAMAAARMPLLALSEMARTYFVPAR